MATGDAGLAAQHFGRSVSIFDLLGDRTEARAPIMNWAGLTLWRNRTAPPSILREPLTFSENSGRVSISHEPKKPEQRSMEVLPSNHARAKQSRSS